MTNAKGTIIKSALKYLVKRQIEQGSVGFAVDNDHDHDCCWDDILAWIEAQPTDAVSREAVLELAKKGILVSNDNYKCVVNAIKSLPPVIPQRKKGQWEKHSSYEGVLICSNCNCGSNLFDKIYKFCPNCGAEMDGGAE